MKTLIAKLLGLYLNGAALVAPRWAGRKSFELFCYPFRGKITPKHRDFFQSGELFQLAIGNHPVQGYRWGNGPRKVLFLHGWQSHTFRWKTYIEALDKEQYTIYSIDAPAHGLSPGNFMTVPVYSEAVQHAIQHMGKIDTVVCHSLGGFTALYTFHQAPYLAPKKLIALAPPGEASEFFEFYGKKLGLSKKSLRVTTDHFVQVVGQRPDFFSAPAFAATLNIPGLLVHDEEDDETSVENSKAIHRAWPASRLVVTKGNGHNLKSHEVVKLVIDFIEDGHGSLKIQTRKPISVNLTDQLI
jgi:pimeloyl-ACP methyl ester carboxylesterase